MDKHLNVEYYNDFECTELKESSYIRSPHDISTFLKFSDNLCTTNPLGLSIILAVQTESTKQTFPLDNLLRNIIASLDSDSIVSEKRKFVSKISTLFRENFSEITIKIPEDKKPIDEVDCILPKGISLSDFVFDKYIKVAK